MTRFKSKMITNRKVFPSTKDLETYKNMAKFYIKHQIINAASKSQNLFIFGLYIKSLYFYLSRNRLKRFAGHIFKIS